MPQRHTEPTQRRREREANSCLRRVDAQRSTLATRYGQASTPGQRFAVVADALRAATAPGAHQPDQAAADRALEPLIDAMRQALDRLHTHQRSAAEKTLTQETERRSARVRSTRTAA